MSHLSFLVALVLFASLMPLPARMVSAIFFQAPDDYPEQVYMHAGDESIPLSLPRMNLGQWIKFPAGDLVLWFTKESVDPALAIPAEAPSVNVPAQWSEVILLFSVSSKSKEFPFTVTALPSGMSQFKPGEMIFFNRTTSTIGGNLGEKSVRIESGTTIKITSPVSKDGDYSVKLAYSPENRTDVLPLADTTWRYNTTARQMLFILPDVARGVPRIWSVTVPKIPEKRE
jgi:hypothetical protein